MIGKLIKGRGASGLCAYLMGERDHNGETRPRADVIGGTFAGRTAGELAREFSQLHSLRPNLGVHVAHMSLRVPEDERKLSDDEWAAIGREWSEGMGFEGYAVVSHGDHIHVAASRVRLDGSAVPDSQDWQRSERLIRSIEVTHGLRQVEASHLLEPEKSLTHRKALTMPQIALAERGIEPAGQIVANFIEAQLAHGQVTASDFAASLERAGITVIPNIASTGRLNGFAYELNGERITAAALGRGFTLGNLTKRGLSYEQSRDGEYLGELRNRPEARILGRPGGAPSEHADRPAGQDRGSEDEPGAVSRADGRTDAAAGGSDGSPDRGDAANPDERCHAEQERARDGAGIGAGNLDSTEKGLPGRPRVDDSGPGPNRGTAHGTEQSTTSAVTVAPGVPVQPRADSSGAVAGLEARGSPHVAATPAGPSVERLRALAGIVPTDDRTLYQVRRQLAAFGAEAYEVQPIPPKGVEMARERIRKWTAAQVQNALGWLKRANALGYDIFIRPAAPTEKTAHPLAFVDDIDRTTVRRMAKDGLPFAVLNESSPGRYHGWVRIADEPLDRQEVTTAAKMLAAQYGADPASADWRHYGRLAGTTNQKPSRRTEKGPPFVLLEAASAETAPAGAEVLAQVREHLMQQSRIWQNAMQAAYEDAARKLDPARMGDAGTQFEKARSEANPARPEDESARDFSACMSLLRRGYSEAEVAAALRSVSPGLEQRHAQADDYIARTVANASARVQGTPPTWRP